MRARPKAWRRCSTRASAGLPHFNPDDDVEPLDPAVAELRAAIDAADAVLFSTPEYAGALPGSFKNLLDWTIGGGEIYEKPVGWINASALGGATDAYESLGIVLRYAGHAHRRRGLRADPARAAGDRARRPRRRSRGLRRAEPRAHRAHRHRLTTTLPSRGPTTRGRSGRARSRRRGARARRA